jgi:hypothetical protein
MISSASFRSRTPNPRCKGRRTNSHNVSRSTVIPRHARSGQVQRWVRRRLGQATNPFNRPNARHPRPTRTEYNPAWPRIGLKRRLRCDGFVRQSRYPRRACSRTAWGRRAKQSMKSSVTMEFTVRQTPPFGSGLPAPVLRREPREQLACPANGPTTPPTTDHPPFLLG